MAGLTCMDKQLADGNRNGSWASRTTVDASRRLLKWDPMSMCDAVNISEDNLYVNGYCIGRCIHSSWGGGAL